MRAALFGALLPACGAAASKPLPIWHAAPPPPPPVTLQLTNAGLGPLVAGTLVGPAALAGMFPTLQLRAAPARLATVVAEDGGETLFEVIEHEGFPGDGPVATVVVRTARIAGPRPGWRVGEALVDVGALEACSCAGTLGGDTIEVTCSTANLAVGVTVVLPACGGVEEVRGATITALTWQAGSAP